MWENSFRLMHHLESPAALGPVMSRRGFVKRFVLGTASATVLGRLWEVPVLAGVTPGTAGHLRIRLSDYPALQEDFGSVRLGLNPIDDPYGPVGNFYPILITRESPEVYYALDTACAHAGCIVPKFRENEGGIVCPCHGSAYWLDGTLLNGPSVNNLRRFPLTFDGDDTITVEMPNVAYCVTVSRVHGGNDARLRLEFPTIMSVEYEVKFRPDTATPWNTVPFSLTSSGALDRHSVFGDDTVQSVYVSRGVATGFFSIAMKLLDLTPE